MNATQSQNAMFRQISRGFMVLNVVACSVAALKSWWDAPFFIDVFAGMGTLTMLPSITSLALMQPVGLFTILLGSLGLILLVKEFVIRNPVWTMCINLAGTWIGFALIMLSREAMWLPMVEMIRGVQKSG